MATKTISLDEEAYERLKARKQEGESFSAVVKRLAGERSWTEVVGILDTGEADALKAAIEEGRSRLGNGVTSSRTSSTRRLGATRKRNDSEDTSFIIDLLRGDEDAKTLLDIIEKESRPQKISSVTALELYESVACFKTAKVIESDL